MSNPDFDGILFTVQEKFQLIGTDTRKHKKLIEIHMLRVLDHLRLKQFNHTFQGESWGKHMMKMSVEDEFDTNSLLFEILLIIIKGKAFIVINNSISPVKLLCIVVSSCSANVRNCRDYLWFNNQWSCPE